MASKRGTKKSSAKVYEPHEVLSLRRSELVKLHGKKDSGLKTKDELLADLTGGAWDHRPKDGGDSSVAKPF